MNTTKLLLHDVQWVTPAIDCCCEHVTRTNCLTAKRTSVSRVGWGTFQSPPSKKKNTIQHTQILSSLSIPYPFPNIQSILMLSHKPFTFLQHLLSLSLSLSHQRAICFFTLCEVCTPLCSAISSDEGRGSGRREARTGRGR